MKEKNHMVYNTNKKSLVFGLNLKGEIIQFDLECQKITGYSRSDVINKKIDEFLIPLSYIGKWRNIFDLIKNNKNVSDFEIPWLKSDGAEILLTWNSETIVDNDGSLKQILFIGKNKKFSDTYIIKNKSEKKFEDNYKFNNVKSNVSKNEIETNFYKESKKNINELVKSKNIKLDNLDTRQLLPPPLRKKRIVFEKDGKTIYFEASSLLESEKKSKIKKEESHNDSMVNKQFLSSYNKTDEQSKPVKIYKNDKKVIDIIKKYDMLNNKLIELEKKDRKLERKNKMLEKNLKNLRLYLKKNNMIISVRDSERFEIGNQKIKNEDYSKIKLKNVFYPFRIKKRHKEFEIKRIELENRAKELDKLEAKLINDRKTHDKKIAEFVTWKEKLFSLESEIEKRRKDIIEQEEFLKKDINSLKLTENISDNSFSDSKDHIKSDGNIVEEDYHDILDKIPQCAAIIQRSIVKQVNSPFADLIGFDTDEIIDKSLFDFIASEGLVEIEKYYLNRLKGNDISKYQTIFSTKDDSKIKVEVNIKSTVYNGEKAEIAVVSEIDDLNLNDNLLDGEKHTEQDGKIPIEIKDETGEDSQFRDEKGKDVDLKTDIVDENSSSETKKSQEKSNSMLKNMRVNAEDKDVNNEVESDGEKSD